VQGVLFASPLLVYAEQRGEEEGATHTNFVVDAAVVEHTTQHLDITSTLSWNFSSSQAVATYRFYKEFRQSGIAYGP
jgi:hypothetical protein